MVLTALPEKLDFYTEKVNRIVFMSTCVISPYHLIVYNEFSALLDVDDWWKAADELNYFNEYAYDEAMLDDQEVCLHLGNSQLKCDLMLPDDKSSVKLNRALSLKTYLYYYQLAFEDRFQEYIDMEDYYAGNHVSDLIDLASITGLPIDFIHTKKDSVCPESYARDFYETIGASEKAFYTVPGELNMAVGELPYETIFTIINLIENG